MIVMKEFVSLTMVAMGPRKNVFQLPHQWLLIGKDASSIARTQRYELPLSSIVSEVNKTVFLLQNIF